MGVREGKEFGGLVGEVVGELAKDCYSCETGRNVEITQNTKCVFGGGGMRDMELWVTQCCS